MRDSHRTAFLREFIRDPFTVAAVAPSGEPLASLVTAPVPRSGDPLVVELGPGTGAFTAAIQRRLAGRGHHLAVEVNERFAGLLAARYPRIDVAVADVRRASAGGTPERRHRHARPGGRFHHVRIHARPLVSARPATRAVAGQSIRGGCHRPDGVGQPAARIRLLLPAAPRTSTTAGTGGRLSTGLRKRKVGHGKAVLGEVENGR